MKTPPRQQGPAGPGPEQAALAVREATPDDAPLVHSMVRAIAAGTGQADRVESTAAGLARDGFGPGRAFTALLAFAGEEPLGLAIYYPEYSSWRGQR
ncbi:MAG TPA: hypothetical protein VJ947_04715, partial [Pseudohaliea sp.]|nr:hypothetical protein [Pseudohaliea sp.]